MHTKPRSTDLLARVTVWRGFVFRTMKTLEERFWEKVNKTIDCWEWIGAIDRHGYGKFSIKYKKYIAHRISWELHNGKIPKGICVLHRCDNRKCMNPEHLWLGTQQDNSDDMIRKGRSANRENMKKIQQRYNIVDKCPNGVVGEKISVAVKLSEYFAEMDSFGLTENDRKDIRIAMLECLNKITKIFGLNYKL